MAAVKALVIDLQGVLFEGSRAVSGAAEALEKLKRLAVPHCFLTNTTSMTRAGLLDKLHRLGLEVPSDRLLMPVSAARAYLAEEQITECQFVCNDGLVSEFEGITPVEEKAGCVLVGDNGRNWSYDTLNRAMLNLLDGARLVALHRGRYFKDDDGLQLDAGAFVAALEYAASCEAVVMGKPSPAFFNRAVEMVRAQAGEALKATEIAMVGDDVLSDIDAAMQAGLRGILVKTGKYTPAAVKRSGVSPDYTVESIVDAVASLLL